MTPFKVHRPYTIAGDQPQAIETKCLYNWR